MLVKSQLDTGLAAEEVHLELTQTIFAEEQKAQIIIKVLLP